MDAFNSFHSSSLKLKITCSLFLRCFSLRAEICNWRYPPVSDRMSLFNSSSKEILYFITHQRHVVFCSWKFIFLCKCYRNKALNIPGPLVESEQTGIYWYFSGCDDNLLSGKPGLQQMWKAWTTPAQLSGKEGMLQLG